MTWRSGASEWRTRPAQPSAPRWSGQSHMEHNASSLYQPLGLNVRDRPTDRSYGGGVGRRVADVGQVEGRRIRSGGRLGGRSGRRGRRRGARGGAQVHPRLHLLLLEPLFPPRVRPWSCRGRRQDQRVIDRGFRVASLDFVFSLLQHRGLKMENQVSRKLTSLCHELMWNIYTYLNFNTSCI